MQSELSTIFNESTIQCEKDTELLKLKTAVEALEKENRELREIVEEYKNIVTSQNMYLLDILEELVHRDHSR